MDSRRGFSLFELLVILLIIGILVSIAVSSFSKSVAKTADTAAASDLRNAMTAQEAYMAENETYAAVGSLPLTVTTGVTLTGGGSANGYSMTSRHQRSTASYSVTVGDGSATDGLILKQ